MKSILIGLRQLRWLQRPVAPATLTLALTLAFAVTLATAASAQTTLTGKWQGDTPGGARVVLDLTVKDATLTGTLNHNDEPLPIADGTVSKSTFTFKATLNGETQGFTGEFAGGDELKVWMDQQGPDRAVVMKRIKP